MKLIHILPMLLLSPSITLLENEPIEPAEPGPTAARDGNPRQFDFWVGSWECRTQAGQLAGLNKIEKILGDRVLQENWESNGGSSGKSFNIYQADNERKVDVNIKEVSDTERARRVAFVLQEAVRAQEPK